MKRYIIYSIVVLAAVAGFLFWRSRENSAAAADLPGKNLDLYAVLDLFKKSHSMEDFEKSLNSKSAKVNNLDLNNDGKVDYIRVIDSRNGDIHDITLRVPLAKGESQDVAVIEIEKKGDKQAQLQLIGDEDLYGKDYIIEPKKETAQAGFVFTTDVFVNVWYWPDVELIYSPEYVVWVSPWEWDYYPYWYATWDPVVWNVYYPEVEVYHTDYIYVNRHRMPEADHYYYAHHVSSDRFVKANHGDRNYGGRRVGPGNDDRHDNAITKSKNPKPDMNRPANATRGKNNAPAPGSQNARHQNQNGKAVSPKINQGAVKSSPHPGRVPASGKNNNNTMRQPNNNSGRMQAPHAQPKNNAPRQQMHTPPKASAPEHGMPVHSPTHYENGGMKTAPAGATPRGGGGGGKHGGGY